MLGAVQHGCDMDAVAQSGRIEILLFNKHFCRFSAVPDGLPLQPAVPGSVPAVPVPTTRPETAGGVARKPSVCFVHGRNNPSQNIQFSIYSTSVGSAVVLSLALTPTMPSRRFLKLTAAHNKINGPRSMIDELQESLRPFIASVLSCACTALYSAQAGFTVVTTQLLTDSTKHAAHFSCSNCPLSFPPALPFQRLIVTQNMSSAVHPVLLYHHCSSGA